MSTTPTPQPNPTPQQLGVTLGQTLTYIANAQNTALENEYNAAVAAYNAEYGIDPSPMTGNVPTPAPPKPPMLTVVNTNAVEALEVQSAVLLTAGQDPSTLNWNSVFSQVQYTPPPVVPNTITITDPVGTQNFGNIYNTVPGDNSPNGAIFIDPRGTFVKTVVATPFGNESYWTLKS